MRGGGPNNGHNGPHNCWCTSRHDCDPTHNQPLIAPHHRNRQTPPNRYDSEMVAAAADGAMPSKRACLEAVPPPTIVSDIPSTTTPVSEDGGWD